MLYHTSERAGIQRFEPRPSPGTGDPVVWAIDWGRLRNYLLPRECPRVTFYAGPETSSIDIDRFLGSSQAVVAFESAWLDRVRSTRLYCYHLPEDGFRCVDQIAGCFVNSAAVIPAAVESFDDLLGALGARGVEIRIVSSLWPLHDAVIDSSLCYSMIRMRNTGPRNVEMISQ